MKVIIRINCPDTTGIISSVTQFIHSCLGNVIYLDQHVDKSSNVFFMRLETEFDPSNFNTDTFKNNFKQAIALPYNMRWSLHLDTTRPKMALFVSKYNHCLYDLLGRHNSGELAVEIPFILSNHPDLKFIADQFNIRFYHVPFSKKNREKAEKKQLALLAEHQIDFIVLARYMQIVSNRLIDVFPNRIINIHHSFLPAFAGAKPYHAAFKRGVKIIGATSHYVTTALDEGPIIEQDVIPVSHSHTIADFINKGRDLEKIVLSRAIKLHVLRKTMVYNNKTVIFS